MSDRERIRAVVDDMRARWDIDATEEQLEAIVRVALEPKWDDRATWEAEVIATALTAIEMDVRRAKHLANPQSGGSK